MPEVRQLLCAQRGRVLDVRSGEHGSVERRRKALPLPAYHEYRWSLYEL